MEDAQNSQSPSRGLALRPATSFLDRVGQPPAPHAEEHTVHKQISQFALTSTYQVMRSSSGRMSEKP